MGCSSSRRSTTHFVANRLVEGQGDSVVKTCTLLGIDNHDLDLLWSSFQRFDADGGGEISLDEFVIGSHLEICEAFARLVFRMFDSDHSGNITFEEFVISVWGLCSCTTETLAIFSFTLFDLDGSGQLDGSEINFMASLMHDFKPLTNVILALEHLQKTRTGNDSQSISMDEYLDEVQRAAVLLMPATEMQLLLMKATLGISRWVKHQSQRRDRHGKQTIFDILGVSLDDAVLMKVRGLSRVVPPRDSQLGAAVMEKLDRARRIAMKEKDRLAKKAGKAEWDAGHEQRHANDMQRTRIGGNHGPNPSHPVGTGEADNNARVASKAPAPPGSHHHDPAGPHVHHHHTHAAHHGHHGHHAHAHAHAHTATETHSRASTPNAAQHVHNTPTPMSSTPPSRAATPERDRLLDAQARPQAHEKPAHHHHHHPHHIAAHH